MRRQISISFVCLALIACSAPTGATAQNEADARTLVVTGSGEASGAPDIATITIGVETRGQTPGEAIRQNSAQIAKTIKTLKTFGVEGKDLQTASLSLNAQYDYGQNRSNPRVTGYVANNNLRVILRDLDKAGEVLDSVVSAGANRLNGMQFGFAEPQTMMDEARVEAVKKARAKAALLADAANVDLGPILKIQDLTAGARPPAPAFRMEADVASASVPLERGELSLSASVTLIYEIR
ncbi:MAG: SIMPL domain-containing protein [Pseudomonadota bacterium]